MDADNVANEVRKMVARLAVLNPQLAESEERRVLRLERDSIEREVKKLSTRLAELNEQLQESNEILEMRTERNLLDEALNEIANSVQKFDIKPSQVPEYSVDTLGLGVKISNRLKYEEVYTIGQVTSMTEGELLKIEFFGRKSLREIKEALKSKGLSLRKV